jgi:hypothetical protein
MKPDFLAGRRRMICRLNGSALAAVKAEVLEGRLGEAVSVVRAAHLPWRRIFFPAGVHLEELGSFFLHGIETSSRSSHL